MLAGVYSEWSQFPLLLLYHFCFHNQCVLYFYCKVYIYFKILRRLFDHIASF